MTVLVDTSVWWPALRRRAAPDRPEVQERRSLIDEGRVAIIGRSGRNTDFLICAAAERRGFPILTTDADFAPFAEIPPIALHGR